MIVRPRPRFIELLFLLRGSILPRIAPQLLLLFVFSCLVVLLPDHVRNLHALPLPYLRDFLHSFRNAPVTLLGIAISIFLGFRNNACYDRWWEARRQLGQMIGEMRSLARFSAATLPAPERVVRAAIAFNYALTAQLRRQPLPPQVSQYLDPADQAATLASPNPANYILSLITRETTAAYQSGALTDILYTHLDERLATIANLQVACERIASTPTPFTYTLLLHRTAYLFCFPLPIALAPTVGLATPFFCTLVAYTFFGLDALGDELEDPFGDHANTLPLDAMTRITEINLLEVLHTPTLPPFLEPIDHLLR
jgi:putative membrane protein